jgi:hypothetical protein
MLLLLRLHFFVGKCVCCVVVADDGDGARSLSHHAPPFLSPHTHPHAAWKNPAPAPAPPTHPPTTTANHHQPPTQHSFDRSGSLSKREFALFYVGLLADKAKMGAGALASAVAAALDKDGDGKIGSTELKVGGWLVVESVSVFVCFCLLCGGCLFSERSLCAPLDTPAPPSTSALSPFRPTKQITQHAPQPQTLAHPKHTKRAFSAPCTSAWSPTWCPRARTSTTAACCPRSRVEKEIGPHFLYFVCAAGAALRGLAPVGARSFDCAAPPVCVDDDETTNEAFSANERDDGE